MIQKRDALHLLVTRYQQAELVHSRWAMIGVAGILFPEVSVHS